MARYVITYRRPGEKPARHELEAKAEPEARIRFINLSWVAFTEIEIVSVGPKGGATIDYNAAPRRADLPTKPPAEPKRSAPKPATKQQALAAYARATKTPWTEIVAKLGEEIGTLADRAQELTRQGKHDEADALRAEAKKLAADRAAITKRNTRK